MAVIRQFGCVEMDLKALWRHCWLNVQASKIFLLQSQQQSTKVVNCLVYYFAVYVERLVPLILVLSSLVYLGKC